MIHNDYWKTKFEQLLQRSGRVRELQKIRQKRGYLTMDEKQRLYRNEKDLDRQIEEMTEELKKDQLQPGLF